MARQGLGLLFYLAVESQRLPNLFASLSQVST